MAYYKFTVKTISIIAIVLVMLGINTKDNSSNNVSASPNCGTPMISEEYDSYERLNIDQIVEDKNYIYILLGDHDGVVQIFDHEGNHILTASFYKHMNGAFRIAAQDGDLYVRDCRFNIYVFQNGAFHSFLKEEEACDIIDSIDFNQNSANYEVRSGSVWRVADNVNIINRPIKSAFNTECLFYISIALVLIIGCIKRYKLR